MLELEYLYLILFALLLLLPTFLIRLKIPVGITCFVIGVVFGYFGYFSGDPLVTILSQLGITSLFLFAGMEVDINELKQDSKTICFYLLKSTGLVVISSFFFNEFFGIDYRAALIFSTALFTPSAGFILSSMGRYDFNEKERYWIKVKAISKEIVSILILFFALKSDSLKTLATSNGLLLLLIAVLPFVFMFFLKFLAPYAAQSEVTFLVFLALICGIFTKKIGAYYLVGAFIAGVVAGQFKHFSKGKQSHRILDSLSAFYGIFVPFYFFKAGLGIKMSYFSGKAILLGLGLFVIISLIRVLSNYLNIKLFIKGIIIERRNIAYSLLPTFIFGLVIVDILSDPKFNIPEYLLGALIIYTVSTSILPGLMFKGSVKNLTSSSSKIKEPEIQTQVDHEID